MVKQNNIYGKGITDKQMSSRTKSWNKEVQRDEMGRGEKGMIET
jgi:hypothetical protein